MFFVFRKAQWSISLNEYRTKRKFLWICQTLTWHTLLPETRTLVGVVRRDCDVGFVWPELWSMLKLWPLVQSHKFVERIKSDLFVDLRCTCEKYRKMHNRWMFWSEPWYFTWKRNSTQKHLRVWKTNDQKCDFVLWPCWCCTEHTWNLECPLRPMQDHKHAQIDKPNARHSAGAPVVREWPKTFGKILDRAWDQNNEKIFVLTSCGRVCVKQRCLEAKLQPFRPKLCIILRVSALRNTHSTTQLLISPCSYFTKLQIKFAHNTKWSLTNVQTEVLCATSGSVKKYFVLLGWRKRLKFDCKMSGYAPSLLAQCRVTLVLCLNCNYPFSTTCFLSRNMFTSNEPFLSKLATNLPAKGESDLTELRPQVRKRALKVTL